MADIAKEFMVWLVWFAAAAVVSLAALHLIMRRMRSLRKAQEPMPGQGPSGRLSLFNRIAVVLVIGGIYAGLLGPIAGSVLAYLKSSVAAEETSRRQTSAEQNGSGQSALVPVPDPISTDE